MNLSQHSPQRLGQAGGGRARPCRIPAEGASAQEETAGTAWAGLLGEGRSLSRILGARRATNGASAQSQRSPRDPGQAESGQVGGFTGTQGSGA